MIDWTFSKVAALAAREGVPSRQSAKRAVIVYPFSITRAREQASLFLELT